jgi:hypothetical protein
MAGKSGKNAMRLARFSRFSTKNPEKKRIQTWLLARKLESLKSGFMSWPLKQKEREGSGRRSEALIGRRGYFHLCPAPTKAGFRLVVLWWEAFLSWLAAMQLTMAGGKVYRYDACLNRYLILYLFLEHA